MKKTTATLLMALIATAVSAQGLVLDMAHLADIKRSQDPVLTASKAAIVRAADKIINDPPATVMDKKATAPSGDRHDYYSMARYWWPNPKTADHLPYIRKDGQNNPETLGLDRENLSAFGKQMQVLTLAYYYSGEERFARKAWQCLMAWYADKKTRMNPHLTYSQVVLGRDNNMGRKEGLLDTYTMLPVNDYITLLKPSGSYREKDAQAVRQWFTDFLAWMRESDQGQGEFNSKNNHGTAYHIQVAVYAAATGDTALARQYVNSFTERRIMTQIEPDGRQPKELVRTTAFGYSCFNLGHMLDMLDVARLQGIDLLADTLAAQRIQAAIDYLTPFLGRPAEAWPYQQIRDWEKQQQSLCWILYRAHRYFPDKGYMDLFNKHNTAKPSSRNYLYY